MPKVNPGPRLVLYGPDEKYGATPRPHFRRYIWYIVWHERGQRSERSTGACREDRERAEAVFRLFGNERHLIATGTQKPPPRFAYAIYKRARDRALKRNIAFELTLEYVRQLIAETDDRCTVTGIPFDYDSLGKRFKRPWAPSIDRKEPALGYVKGNCRIVCIAANLAMHVWGEDVLRHLAESYIVWARRNSATSHVTAGRR